jgi:hypothetical protein
MASKKIKFPKDVFNRANRGTYSCAKYVLAESPLIVFLTAWRNLAGDFAIIRGCVGVPDPTVKYSVLYPIYTTKDYDVTEQEALMKALGDAHEDIFEFLRKQVVNYKATLNAAKK